MAAERARAALADLERRIAASTTAGLGAGLGSLHTSGHHEPTSEAPGLGCGPSQAAPSAQADAFLASLGPSPMMHPPILYPPPPPPLPLPPTPPLLPAAALLLPPPPPPAAAAHFSPLQDLAHTRRTGFDVLPPSAGAFGGAMQSICGVSTSLGGGLGSGGDGDVQSTALAAARRMAEAITAAAPPAAVAAAAASSSQQRAYRSLDEVLARDRARIAAADMRNQTYVLEQAGAAKARAKSAAAAAAAAAAAPPPPPPVMAITHAADDGAPPPAKAPRLAARSHAGAAAACSVYVCGLPAEMEASELERHMEQVGPVVRVKLYREADGALKGDALVTYQKDAAVLGALQLLSGIHLRPGMPLSISRPVWGHAPASAPADASLAHAAAVAEPPPAAPAAPAAPAISAPARLIPGLAPARSNPVAAAAATAAPSSGNGAPSTCAVPFASCPSSLSSSSSSAAAVGGTTDGAMSEEALRVVVVRHFFCPAEVPPASDFEARRQWTAQIIDELWEEVRAPPPTSSLPPTLPAATHCT